MLKKLAPLIILALFAAGVYFMTQGMQNVVDITSPEKAKVKEEIKK